MEGRPWPEWKGKPISSNAVARLLKPFGIKPGCVGDRKKDSGYEVKQFEEAFTRYLSPSTPSATPAALNGKLRLCARNEPPQAMVQHLREHKRA